MAHSTKPSRGSEIHEAQAPATRVLPAELTSMQEKGSLSCQVIPQNHNLVYMTKELKDCIGLTLFEVLGNCMDIQKDDGAWGSILTDSMSYLLTFHILVVLTRRWLCFGLKHVGHTHT